MGSRGKTEAGSVKNGGRQGHPVRFAQGGLGHDAPRAGRPCHVRGSGLSPLRGWLGFSPSPVPWLAPWAKFLRPPSGVARRVCSAIERTAGRKGPRYNPRPGGPEDFSPRRKTWDSIHPITLSAPEGRKTRLSTDRPGAAHVPPAGMHAPLGVVSIAADDDITAAPINSELKPPECGNDATP